MRLVKLYYMPIESPRHSDYAEEWRVENENVLLTFCGRVVFCG